MSLMDKKVAIANALNEANKANEAAIAAQEELKAAMTRVKMGKASKLEIDELKTTKDKIIELLTITKGKSATLVDLTIEGVELATKITIDQLEAIITMEQPETEAVTETEVEELIVAEIVTHGGEL